jgi:hypothetical protein
MPLAEPRDRARKSGRDRRRQEEAARGLLAGDLGGDGGGQCREALDLVEHEQTAGRGDRAGVTGGLGEAERAVEAQCAERPVPGRQRPRQLLCGGR